MIRKWDKMDQRWMLLIIHGREKEKHKLQKGFRSHPPLTPSTVFTEYEFMGAIRISFHLQKFIRAPSFLKPCKALLMKKTYSCITSVLAAPCHFLFAVARGLDMRQVVGLSMP